MTTVQGGALPPRTGAPFGSAIACPLVSVYLRNVPVSVVLAAVRLVRHLLGVSTELLAHRRQDLLGVGVLLARAEPGVQGRRHYIGLLRFLDRHFHGPQALPGRRYTDRVLRERL